MREEGRERQNRVRGGDSAGGEEAGLDILGGGRESETVGDITQMHR